MTATTTTMMRVRRDLHAKLHALAEEEQVSMQEVLHRALDSYGRMRLLESTNRAYATLHNDPEAWSDLLEERTVFDGTLADGLPPAEEFANWR